MTTIDLNLLKYLDSGKKIDNHKKYCEKNGIHPKEFVGALKSLEADEMVESKVNSLNVSKVTSEGEKILKKGKSVEVEIFESIPAAGILKSELSKLGFSKGDMKAGLNNAQKNGWITQKKISKKDAKVTKKVTSVNDNVLGYLKDLSSIPPKTFKLLKKRKLVTTIKEKYFSVKKGENFSTKRVKPCTDVTVDMIQDGSWETAFFKTYNFKSYGKKLDVGALHPLLKVRTEFRNIFFEMGFEEMKTNKYVESSFWNFDSLFQPQQHPARDAHDTFFLKNPSSTLKLPKDYVQRVKNVHEKGGYGSNGYRYNWELKEAKKNILRTHTTAVSSRYLYALAQEIKSGKNIDELLPKKYYSIDKVFRNEEMDATHLCEFNQIEGMVIGKNLSLGDLIGLLNTFFGKIGIKKLKFKPAYNPYTEPSLEIFGKHPDLGWIELGNSGMFRPEMLLPMGLPKDVRVIAWGLSLERPTMIKYGIKAIRELVGHKVPVKKIWNNPICYY